MLGGGVVDGGWECNEDPVGDCLVDKLGGALNDGDAFDQLLGTLGVKKSWCWTVFGGVCCGPSSNRLHISRRSLFPLPKSSNIFASECREKMERWVSVLLAR
eukprot:m.910764 g.910764  ORF g.910764 m.910764 type:complete len:102 (+) comp60112_c0_seq27:107-412(+)